jgi:hypothetical protein
LEEWGREENIDGFKVHDAVGGGLGEGSKFVDQRAGDNLGEGRGDNLEWLKGRGLINDDGRRIVADAEEASNLVRGRKEDAAKVLGVVEEDDLFLWFAMRRKSFGSLFSAIIFLRPRI